MEGIDLFAEHSWQSVPHQWTAGLLLSISRPSIAIWALTYLLLNRVSGQGLLANPSRNVRLEM
jgi:hypothetical protein